MPTLITMEQAAQKLSKKSLALWERNLEKNAHKGVLTEGLSSMFVREGLPEDFFGYENIIEEILLERGCGAYIKDEKSGLWCFGACELGGEPDPYGFGTIAIVALKNGAVYEVDNWRTSDDVVVCFNTPIRVRDLNIPIFSDFLMEIGTSLRSQLKNSRLHPIPLANDEKSKAAIEEALASMDRGELRTILSPNVVKTLVEMGVDARAIEVLSLSDPTASDHIQYIAKLRDDVMRWFWNYYGHNPESTGKLAQQSVAEVTTGASIAMILPHARYHARQQEAEMLKKKFGWDVTIEFSEPWQNAFAKCEAEAKAAQDIIEGGEEDVRNQEDNDSVEDAGDSEETGSESDEV